jgi:hypothetical protein
MTDKKKMRVEFAPGCFDNFEGTQEELDAFVAEIQRMADSGELEENSVPIHEDEELWDQLTSEEQDEIMQAIGKLNQSRRLN